MVDAFTLQPAGDFSNEVRIDLAANTLVDSEPDEFRPVATEHEITTVEIFRLSSNFLVNWEGPAIGQNGVKSYEVSVNNTRRSTLKDFTYITNPRLDCTVVSVAVISDDDKVLDYKTVVYRRSSTNNGGCGGSAFSGAVCPAR